MEIAVNSNIVDPEADPRIAAPQSKNAYTGGIG